MGNRNMGENEKNEENGLIGLVGNKIKGRGISF